MPPIEARVKDLIDETRLVMQLSAASKVVHWASLGVVAIAVVPLIAPAAHRRIAAAGNAEEGMFCYVTAMMLPAESLTALGLVGESYVAVSMILDSIVLAVVLSLAAAIGFRRAAVWVPLAVRGGRASGRAAR